MQRGLLHFYYTFLHLFAPFFTLLACRPDKGKTLEITGFFSNFKGFQNGGEEGI